MAQPSGHSAGAWLHRFTLLVALTTLALLAVGGLVTSRGVGMAVPDWPNTYGYNMFLFPVSRWVGGVLYEHSHRLLAAFTGLLTTILAIWLWIRETRSRERWFGLAAILLVIGVMGVRALPIYLSLAGLAPIVAGFAFYQARRAPGTLRWWGIIAFAAVILQGVLGGLRVVWFKDEIGIFHAALAQLFFVLICTLALWTSHWWRESVGTQPMDQRTEALQDTFAETPGMITSSLMRGVFVSATVMIFLQLVLGATMRHQHAGLAIPDFPLAYGKIWPGLDASSVAEYNQRRLETTALNPITAPQIVMQLAHRFMALLITVAVGLCAWISRRQLGSRHPLAKMAVVWLGLIVVQALLGATTIWSNKAADVATAHVLAGALALAFGAIQCIISFRGLVLAPGLAKAEALTPFSFTPPEPSAATGLK